MIDMGHEMSPLNITQPLGIWSIMATQNGDVQYTQNGTVTNPWLIEIKFAVFWGSTGEIGDGLRCPQSASFGLSGQFSVGRRCFSIQLAGWNFSPGI